MKTYTGKVCVKHPEFAGERFSANGACRGCSNERSAKWQRENKERASASDKRWRLANRARRLNLQYLKRYGVTAADKQALLAKQRSKCAICRIATPTKGGWHLDHDHKTKEIRGVLCGRCNWMIGHARESPKVLLAAAKYLQAH